MNDPFFSFSSSTMAFKLKVPVMPRIELYMRAASTAYTIDSVVCPDLDSSTRAFVVATSSLTQILGVLQRTVASTDSNYATATKEPVLVDEDGIWEATVSGTLTANYEMYKLDFKDNVSIDQTAHAKMVFAVVNFVSATLAHGKFTSWWGRSNSLTA